MAAIREIELLAPAKDADSGIAAITYGADAVYIGPEKFGARVAVGNSLSEIERLVIFAHQYHAKVYATINTIIYDNELEQALLLINDLYRVGVDAIIIQDLGILEMDLPPIPIFASTQTHNHSVERVKFLQEVGMQRVILARELSINEIKEISNSTSVDIEAFVHGAICVSYSGQCYMSHYITGRSANRGECAQPCRSAYDLIDENGNIIIKEKHLLSPKDLNLSAHLSNLIDAGVTSFKIEGRLKDVEYVKNITLHYRLLLDKLIAREKGLKRASAGTITTQLAPNPSKSYNRGFTTHFMNGRQQGIASFNTQKAIGQKLGIVSFVSDNWFSIDTQEPLSNNDGLCFFNQNDKLTGIKVNRAEGNRVYPLEMNSIYIGAEIYRNSDKAFSRNLSSDNTRRLIQCSISVNRTASQLFFVVTDEDGMATQQIVANTFDLANNATKAKETLVTQLSKTGDTIYSIERVDIACPEIPFIPISTLNAIRRELLANHTDTRIKNHPRKEVKLEQNTAPLPNKLTSYKDNISNSLAEQFYARHGAANTSKAFELSKSSLPNSLTLMTTRYCIKYELGICPTHQNGKPQTLFLRDNNAIYPLQFDCKQCVMLVKEPQPKNKE
ncbi:MAG: U32 family peptidase [Bacteroidales bacterium]|nr:U32 family peptidase [Bacteroidales bacterium]MBN2749773.1 U32 family peptidase [Bacteroidales bacterium]